MSSALTGNKIKDSYQALLKIGTNGSLDPTTPITISDGLGNDTPLQLAADKLLTNYLGNDIGLNLDFANQRYFLGLNIDGWGLDVDYNNGYIQIGDNYGTFHNFLRFIIDTGTDIIKSTQNGNDIGLKLDFVNSNYLFGDNTNSTGKSSYLELSSNASEAAAIISITGNALNIREYGNIWGGAQGDMGYYDAIYDNFGFTFDWEIMNDNISSFPFYKNTIINTFGSVITTQIAMNNNFFANNSQLSLNSPLDLTSNEILSNCFVFGLTTMVDVNNIRIFSKHAGTYNTNVAIFNGSGLKIGKGGNHIFSVNASGLDFPDDASGITVLGGDVYSENNSIYVKAQHGLSGIKCGINFTGHHAKGTNNLSNVFGYYNVSFGTAVGQVQIEQKQLFANCPDGTGYYNLVDTFENEIIFVENNTTYLLEVKVVSTNGNGNTGSSGNWTYYEQYIICADGSGTLSASNQVINSFGYNPPDQDFKIFANANEFYFQVRPDNANGAHCWVRAEIVLHKIQAI